jgi:hypothetical protein
VKREAGDAIEPVWNRRDCISGAVKFCFHMVITKSYFWGSLNLMLLAVLAWEFRRGFEPLWNYAGPAH